MYVSTACIDTVKNVCASNSTASIPDEPSSCQHCQYKSRMDLKQRYEVHPVFKMYYKRQRACQHCRYKMFYTKQREIFKKGHPEWRFVGIHPSKYVDTVNTGWSGIWNVLLKTERNIKERSSGMKVCQNPSIQICRHSRYRLIRYLKCSTQNSKS